MTLCEANKSSTVGVIVAKESKDKDAKGPVGLSLQLSPEARQVMDNLSDDTGVPNTKSLARIVEWFALLDRKFRLAILNKDEGTRQELAMLTLRTMAKANPRMFVADLGMADSIALLDAIQDHIKTLSATVKFQAGDQKKP